MKRKETVLTSIGIIWPIQLHSKLDLQNILYKLSESEMEAFPLCAITAP